ncbi:FAD binding domain-containing protein [Paraburkholderia sp. BCC1885]|uniref:FAD binding domain-containing protein n=1 Tax=Paraburkholderia sp. BCC1885 TaxID=2562669 RepID=UPI0011844882|nr:xanthine dehydrogenase family protein subunit M [Paraburkholderia sp. BCC1885]
MKAAAFQYVKPRTLADVFAVLAEYEDGARIVAGGQTLLATLNMRLSEPQMLVDITALDGLRGITVGEHNLRIGALVTHAQIEDSAVIREHAPLLFAAAPHVAHRAIRNRGTFGGSIALADPAAEWPACAVALDATIVVCGPAGERRIDADAFFVDLYTTALESNELVVAVEIPRSGPRARFAFDELTRRHGDYAIVGAALTGNLETDGRLTAARAVFFGTGSVPERARSIEPLLAAAPLDTQTIRAAVEALELEPSADLYHSAAAKRHLARVLLGRLLTRLAADGTGASDASHEGDSHVR